MTTGAVTVPNRYYGYRPEVVEACKDGNIGRCAKAICYYEDHSTLNLGGPGYGPGVYLAAKLQSSVTAPGRPVDLDVLDETYGRARKYLDDFPRLCPPPPPIPVSRRSSVPHLRPVPNLSRRIVHNSASLLSPPVAVGLLAVAALLIFLTPGIPDEVFVGALVLGG